MLKSICFLHYGIGWRDGITTVVKTLATQLQKQNPSLKFYFLGGEKKENILKDASYKIIPQLLPKKVRLTKNYLWEKSDFIAKEIARETKGIEVVIIENPLLGDYHLPAMLGYLLYAKKYKPQGTKIFFRVHDFYKDFPKYYQNFQKLFSAKEIREIVKGEKVDGFLIINQALREKLIRIGVAKEKIFYLPNGIDKTIFNKSLSKAEKNLLYQSLKVPTPNVKILLYPVRVIPRKNIEEAILFVSFIRQITGDNYLLIVAGKIEKRAYSSRTYYKMLKKLARIANLPVIFTQEALPLERQYNQKGEIEKFGIGDLYQASEAILMTSLKEGFGYPFLECWFAKKIVLGRRIEEVIKDFEKNGLKFWWLYSRFLDKANLIKQVEILQNKAKREKIIQANFIQAKKFYEISSIVQRFLEIVY